MFISLCLPTPPTRSSSPLLTSAHQQIQNIRFVVKAGENTKIGRKSLQRLQSDLQIQFGSTMRAIYIICLAFIGFTNAQFCYQDVHTGCTFPKQQVQNCHAKYSAVEHEIPDLQSYIMHHLDHSFQYLLMSTNFATYESSREGFAKLFRKFSDNTWDDAIDLIKYVNKRGGNMDFDTSAPEEPDNGLNKNFNMFELESLSRALDMYKSLASKAHRIHSDVTRRKEDYHDAETISYLENKFVHKHADRIRELAGYSNDLANMLLKGENPNLSLFLFDEYLHKQV